VGRQGAQITLSRHATTLLADFSTAHIGEYVAVVIDGRATTTRLYSTDTMNPSFL